MGLLVDLDLAPLIAAHGLRYLVETDTGDGAGAEHALTYDLDQVFSIEPSHKQALTVALKHSAEQRLTIINAKIDKGLKEALEEIPAEVPAAFWLSDGGKLPLLAGLRDLSADVVLIESGIRADPLIIDGILAASHKVEPADGFLRATPRQG